MSNIRLSLVPLIAHPTLLMQKTYQSIFFIGLLHSIIYYKMSGLQYEAWLTLCPLWIGLFNELDLWVTIHNFKLELSNCKASIMVRCVLGVELDAQGQSRRGKHKVFISLNLMEEALHCIM